MSDKTDSQTTEQLQTESASKDSRQQARLSEGIGEGSLARDVAQAIGLLNMSLFLEANQERIFAKLEECDRFAEVADLNGDMMFIALSLPIMNGIIHVGSNRSDLRKAIEWILSKWKTENKEPDKISILSVLTLMYVVAKGWEAHKNDPGKRDIWLRIVSRVRKLSSESFQEEDEP